MLRALKSENASLREQLERPAAEGGHGRKGDKLRAGPGSVLTSTGYGFVGCQARPKDIAAAEVTGVAPPPVQMYDRIEGGGSVWERQPVVGLRPIGYLESCFLEKNGTPRQGNVAPTSRAVFSLLFGTNPPHCLQGLEEFSHVWVLWLFHDNGNKRLAPLVHPPRLDGGKKGIFATRTPHRPNPIGLSLCKLEGIDGKVVKLSGVDMIHGTPILDIKPFIPEYDGEADAARVRVADWIARPPIAELDVNFSATAEQQLQALLPTFKHFGDVSQVRLAIADVLHSDPRRCPCLAALRLRGVRGSVTLVPNHSRPPACGAIASHTAQLAIHPCLASKKES